MHNLTSTPQPFDFEKMVDATSRHRWVQRYWHLSIYFCVVYIIVIFSIKHYMKIRSAFDLRIPLLLWNIAHAVICTFGAFRMAPGLYLIVREFGFTFSICDSDVPKTIQATVFWTWIFPWVKITELGDILFIVLRKRNLAFVQWYHHAVTCILAWYLISQLVAVGHLFLVLNYIVHSVFYTYYTFSGLGFKPVQKLGMLVLIIELLQLSIAAFACFWAILEKYYGQGCSFSDNAILLSFFIFLSYIFLFSTLFYNKYICKAEIIKKKR